MTVLDRARAWTATDPDPETRAELSALIDRAAAGDDKANADLADRFSGSLVFGTAGLRGRVEGGTARMNRAVVIRATHGLGAHVVHSFGADGAKKRGVVIGFDGRLSSRQFAEDAAAVLAAQGVAVHLFFDPVPTPLCAYAVEKLGACAGIMVTASHNPPADNGYKVYWENAAQIIPPQDEAIEAAIQRAPAANAIARMAPPDAAAQGLRRIISDEVELAYLAGVRAMAAHKPNVTGLAVVHTPVPLRIVYTAMHGVGHRLTLRALQQAGFEGVVDVPSQADPDGTFRTVAFPNPEEKGALDRALLVANESAAEIILANDPDADRLAVAVRESDRFRMLSGNEIGVLLCADALDHKDTGGKPKLVITSIVSSTFLSRMAKDKGAAYAEVLTGFKWIANKAMEMAGTHAFVCGYEEALGYSYGPLVKDKDGVGAAVRFAEMTRSLKAQGKTIGQRLDELAVAHGMSVAHNWSVTMPGATGLERIRAAMASLRAEPLTVIDGEQVVNSVDHQAAAIPADVLVYFTDSDARLTVRPSGTEPKIKLYMEMVARAGTTAELQQKKALLEEKGRRVEQQLKARLGL